MEEQIKGVSVSSMENQSSFYNIDKITEFHYLCDRNVERVALEVLGVSSPMFLTQSGLFIKENTFFQDGSLFVDFFRDTFIDLAASFIKKPCFGLDWNIIKESIAIGCPVIILVDVFYMPYKIHFHKDHAAHCILLNEVIDGKYLVIDWYEPDYYIGYIEEEVLNLARQSTNEEDGASVYSGYPIKATYKVVDAKRICEFKFDFSKCIRDNLKNMYEQLISNETARFFDKIKNDFPTWMQNYDKQHYFNAVKSFFFLELELNIFIYYLSEISKLHTGVIEYIQMKEATEQLRPAVLIIKNKLHRAIRKQGALETTSWTNYQTTMLQYYYKILDLLKLVISGGQV